MSLEQFIGLDQGEGMSESAFEAFKERMKAAAAQIAAIKKEESKQKKKEEELLKILLKFIKTSSKKELVLLISRTLEQNIPANFILAVILLGNEEIKEQVGSFIMLEKAIKDTIPDGKFVTIEKPHDSKNEKNSQALVFFNANDEAMPLKVKIELDHWIKNMLFQAEENPHKLLKHAYKIEMIELPKEYDWEESKYSGKKIIQEILIQLITFVLRDFLEQNGLNEPYKKLYEFSSFIIKGILDKTEENTGSMKMLK